MLRPTSDFKDMNDFIAQFRKKPANGNWPLANSQKAQVSDQRSTNSQQEATGNQPAAAGQQEAVSAHGEPHDEPGQAQQSAISQQEVDSTHAPRQAPRPAGTGRVISREEILKNPDAYVIQNGPNPHVTDDYVLAEDGSLVHPRQMEWQVEARIKKQLGMPNNLYDEGAIIAWHKRQLALLEKADAAPRCEHVFMDGTTCQSPRMKKHKYCYAHARMLEVRPKKLKLLPAEDENSIMWNIMEIQRALIDDEITEKKAGLLLYGQQLQLIAVRGVTFKQTDGDEMVRVMPRSGHRDMGSSGHLKTENHTTDNTDNTDIARSSKTSKPESSQTSTEQHRRECRCQTGVERGTASIESEISEQSIPGDELDKSLFSGDEGRGAGPSGERVTTATRQNRARRGPRVIG
jgi:hypothetical protein